MRILKLLKPYRIRVTFGVAFLSLVLVMRLVTPYLSKILVDDVVKGGNLEIMGIVLGAMIALAVFRSIFIYLRAFIFEDVSQKIIFDIRQKMYEHLHDLPYQFYDKHQIGEIMSRMTGDLESIRNLLAGGIITILEQSIFYVGSLIAIFTLSPIMAFALLLITPILAIVGLKFDKEIHPAFRAIREQGAVLNAKTQENISGIHVVKAYAREEYERTTFDVENTEHSQRGINIALIVSKYNPMMEFISSVVPALMLLLGGYLAINTSLESITTGTVVAVFGYIWTLTNPMKMLGEILNMLSQAISSADRIFYYTDFGSAIKEKKEAVFPEKFNGHVTFENVTFSYGDEIVLKDINIDVPAGNTLAVMGATGSGKTSLVNLIGRFYECQQGAVKVDGIDVKDYKIKPLRRQIGYVMQETFLFSDTLESNIAFGNDNATDEEIQRAADIAQASDFISEMDDGLNVIVGERGMGLSGGQKQRTAIARAIATNPSILILDDSTAAVDMETEHAIQQGLKTIMEGKTTFIISHRISSVKDANEIVVLDKGGIAERGTHSQLLEKKGLYYQIFMDQYKDFESISNGKKVI